MEVAAQMRQPPEHEHGQDGSGDPQPGQHRMMAAESVHGSGSGQGQDQAEEEEPPAA
jgi:hypothetical protein